MAKQIRDARVLLKRTIGNASPVVPVIGPSLDHTDGTWASNNVYMGELFLDTMFNKMWVITDTSNNPQEVVMYDENDLNLKGTIRLTDLPPSISSHILYYDDATGHVSYGPPDSTSVNLDISTDDDTVTVTNSSGTDAIIPAATDSIAGVMTINYQEFSGNKVFNNNISADSMSSNSISSVELIGNTLKVGTATNKATISYTTNTERTLTIPNVAGNRTFSFINQTETFNAVKTFSQTPVFQDSINITNNSAVINFTSIINDKSITTGGSTNLRLRPGGNVAIGNIEPTEKLDIDGQLRMRGGNPGLGRLLRSDANGVGEWFTPGIIDSKWDLVEADTSDNPRWNSNANHFGLDIFNFNSLPTPYIISTSPPYVFTRNNALYYTDDNVSGGPDDGKPYYIQFLNSNGVSGSTYNDVGNVHFYMVRMFRAATNAEKLLPDGYTFYDTDSFPSEIGTSGPGSVDDYFSLKCTKIGDNIWLAENLKLVGYFDSDLTVWVNFDQPTGYGQLNNDDPQFLPLSSDSGDTFLNLSYDIGYLYGLGAIDGIKETISTTGFPNGWLLPSRNDYEDLFDYIVENYKFMSDRDISTHYSNLLKSYRQVDSPLGNENFIKPKFTPLTIGDYRYYNI